MLKKFYLIIITMIILSTSVYAADEPSDWAQDNIKRAISQGYIPSDMQNNYVSNITRKDFCELAVHNLINYYGGNRDYMFLKKGVSQRKNPFVDTNDEWVSYAYSMGIINGVSSTEFKPNDYITRQESAVIIKNILHFIGFDISDYRGVNFSDENTFSDWARDSISLVVSKGIMTGTGNNNFSPRINYTRQQAYITFYNINNFLNQNYIGKNITVGENQIALGDSEFYIQSSLKNLKDRYDGSANGKYYVFYTDYSDLLIVKVGENKKVTRIATNASKFSFNSKLKPGYKPSFEEKEKYKDVFIMDGDSLDGIVINSHTENTSLVRGVELEKGLFYFTNAFRKKNGTFTLRNNDNLRNAAYYHSKDMAESGVFSHVSYDGRQLADRIKASNYNYARAGENIAYGYENGFRAYEGLINSEGHRKNMLESFSEMGVGVYFSNDNISYYTQEFGTQLN